ncbi:MAG: hypothetical protein WCA08_12305 [Desulfoferrobacter sp.]
MFSRARHILMLIACLAFVLSTQIGNSANTPEKSSSKPQQKSAEEASTATQDEVIAEEITNQWKRQRSDGDWVAEEMQKHTIKSPADNSDLLTGKQREGHVYGDISKQDILIWNQEVLKLVVDGSRIFHNPDLLGSSIAVSCDMCHPDASNTHPETYPKYQVETGRVVLLRDMINWCLEHAIRAEPLEADSPQMRALEAYIYAQRKGAELNYGKH